MCGICKNQRPSTTNKMPLTKSTRCHDKLSHSNEKMPSNHHISHMHSCGNIPTIPTPSAFINQSTPNKSIISNVLKHWQYSTKFFNRKWIYRYLLTLFILMYAINSSPILLSNAQILKSNRTSAAITQNFNNKIISNSGTGASSVTQKTLSRSNRNNNNNIRKEHLNVNPDIEINERPSCHSCSLRKEVEEDNLKSFKSHILQRLQLVHMPNISMESVTTVSESVLANFYNKYGERYIRLNSRNYDYMDEMMSDEPKHLRSNKNKFIGDDEEEDEDEQFFSSTQSIYSFPNGKYRSTDQYYNIFYHTWLECYNKNAIESIVDCIFKLSLNHLPKGSLISYVHKNQTNV